ncbi:MAG: cytochrome c oxidase assembly protein [Thalassobaculum sp.]|uniref:cytochrome c oxidase assembly protein n=1 Tax=Thalassobaculum sp. TaxID=2022740 RepID=UPI0032EE0429
MAGGNDIDLETRVQRARNLRTGGILAGVVLGMVGMAYASVPLYEIFCRVTGYGGTTQVATAGADRVLDRSMTVRFDSNVNPELPWTFKPVQRSMTLKVGETRLAFYEATNTGSETLVGTATFNVTPDKSGLYFDKIDCFCFTEQVLRPGETVDMPVSFYLDPALADDRKMDGVTTITLSYTFFRAQDQSKARQLAEAPVDEKAAGGAKR